MPTLPWTPARHAADALRAEVDARKNVEVLVLGSRLELQHYRDVPRFLVAALKIRKQVHHSDGAVGVSLIAQPARKTFWTLSAWTDQDALEAFVRTPPHVDVMGRFRGRLQDTGFETWMVDAVTLPKPHSNAKELWHEAKAHLAGDSKESSSQ